MLVYTRDRSMTLPRRSVKRTFVERSVGVKGYRCDEGQKRLPSLMEQHVLKNAHWVLQAERERKEKRKARRRAANINKQALAILNSIGEGA